jgi:LAS superfamily LD-carboxypeptidase LdcB
MRVVDPKSFKHSKGRKKFVKLSKKSVFILISILSLVLIVIYINSNKASSPELSESIIDTNLVEVQQVIETSSVPTLIQFSGNEIRLLFDNLRQANLTKVNVPPYITGDDIADTRIRQIAEQRGYKLRSSPVSKLTNIDGYPLQKEVHQPWLNLKKSALNDGINISVVSAYRSVNDQRELFLERLYSEGINVTQIAAGKADAAINKVLVTTAVPGYSKHHTGYTLDFVCAGFAFENFKNSDCNQWLVANNYENAKAHGFIPSYPVDADLQGPDPEAWEYVYVGLEVLYE